MLTYDSARTTSRAANNVTLLSAIWIFTAVLILPAIFHWPATMPHYGPDRYVRFAAGYAAVAGIGFLIYRVESRMVAKTQALGLIFLVFLLTSLVNHFHYYLVDGSSSYFGNVTNLYWQTRLHEAVIQLSPAAIPHSYRFLPNAFVRWLQIWHLEFEPSRDLYRLIFIFLLFYAIYRYARLYTGFTGAVLATLLCAVIYPVTFETYAGQLTDPMAHLAFVLGLIFLTTGNFPLFLSTLLIGSLAKETVLALAGYYLLFHRKDPKYRARALALAVFCPLMYLGVHFYVLHHGDYPVPDTSLSRIITDRSWVAILQTNLYDPRWPRVVPLTGLALVPFLFFAWRRTPKPLKYVATYVLIVVFVSNIFFSWLAETRNLMPAVFVLAVVAARLIGEDSPERGTPAVQASRVEAVDSHRFIHEQVPG